MMTPKQNAMNAPGTVTILPTVRVIQHKGMWVGLATIEPVVTGRPYHGRVVRSGKYAQTAPMATQAEALAAARLIRF